jgi:hypothetical protein
MPNPPLHFSRPADGQRAARLEARLALYAQYAALVGDEVAAAWSDDPARAGTLPRAIAASRAALAEHFAELRDASHEPPADGAWAFDDLLADAVTELEHHAALDRALRSQIETLRSARARAALPAGGRAEVAGATPAVPATDAAEKEPPEPLPVDAGVAPLGGALVAARSSGVGGTLGGQYPGVAACGVPSLGGAPDAPEHKLDVRF